MQLKETIINYSSPSLMATITGGLCLSYLFGMIAQKVKISPLVGYIAAGFLIGPFTPGFVGNSVLAGELAEIGIILIMFGVGLHFSLNDLISVRSVAFPGAIVQIFFTSSLGFMMAKYMGCKTFSGVLFGLCFSTSSTLVLLRTLEEKKAIYNKIGKIAVGWLVVEDLTMILTLMILPVLSSLLNDSNFIEKSFFSIFIRTMFTITKISFFIVLILIFGKKLIPYLLLKTEETNSRELFTLSILVFSIGIAYASVILFNVSFSTGAFFAGITLNKSKLSQKAAQDILPLKDAFTVLFFVSVGMLLDPIVLLTYPLHILTTLLIIVFGKMFLISILIRSFGYSYKVSFGVSINLAQMGEFSFILSKIATNLHLFSQEIQNLVLSGAVISIVINSFLVKIIDFDFCEE
ncbi:cation:proton antiporter [Candidatus Riesia pediculicola]|uniref:Inner membrane protein YbaL n=1 Tax=Riesia pediculicola (strain USDA) TaxID=515618 RepID=D4G898_RIEPU|nr:cation:proton antiporter [Candidatus Riesia pediculicola]ADD79509.1 inner membrane protein YbaL [Candidatus Riesia pediculicola USDA]ARC53793.1 hypothetical protein AOE55_01350 [Candidatus Riesia pediculicola]ARC54539.1 hypothetical protein AOE56_01515 [Candidatus Riesia pediculicola]QOJ86428.1 cation:proton antiporter [Candidatus Riesia pediculicola]